MIVTEQFYINGKSFTKTYSDANRFVVRDGIEYGEACDPTEYGRTYIEGNLIDSNLDDKAEAYDILVGGTE